MFRKAAIGVVAGLLLMAPAAGAQEAWMELLRQDINTQKVAILTAVLDMTDEQGEAFWPVYRQMETDAGKLYDQRLSLIKSYAEYYTNMDNVKAKELSDGFFKLQDERLALKKKYFKQFEKATSTSLAARALQVLNQIDILIDLQIAQNLPLLQKGLEEMQAAPAASGSGQ